MCSLHGAVYMDISSTCRWRKLYRCGWALSQKVQPSEWWRPGARRGGRARSEKKLNQNGKQCLGQGLIPIRRSQWSPQKVSQPRSPVKEASGGGAWARNTGTHMSMLAPGGGWGATPWLLLPWKTADRTALSQEACQAKHLQLSAVRPERSHRVVTWSQSPPPGLYPKSQ